MKKQLTLRGLVIGLAGMVVITASSMYVALRMGALPWPTVFVTVVSLFALKGRKDSTIGEINCTHTIMSAGAMVAGGLAFTLPGLWMSEKKLSLSPSELSIPSVIGFTITAVILGTLFTTLLRKRMIEKEKLPYPMGVAAYDTLCAGMKGGKEAKTLFSAMGASALFTALRDGWKVIPQVAVLFGGTACAPPLLFYLSPMAFGIGAVIGPVLAFVWFLGTVLGCYVITPIGIATHLFEDMAAATVFRQNLGLGLMIGTGGGLLIKALKDIITAKGEKSAIALTQKEIKAALLVVILSIVMLIIFTPLTIIESVLMIVAIFVATYLASMLTGQTGINPMEILGILSLLFVRVFSNPSLQASFIITAVTAVACGLAGDVMNDLKCGHMLKADAKQQIIGEGIGGVGGAIVSVATLVILHRAFGEFGTTEMPAPQAAAVSAMIGGVEHMPAFITGTVIGILLFLLHIPAATLGLGFYLPNSALSATMALGALVMVLLRKFSKKNNDKVQLTGNLLASGFLGGEGITGVIIAIIAISML